jgi:hypothetical protein
VQSLQARQQGRCPWQRARRPTRGHGEADVGGAQRGRVVGAVASHGHHVVRQAAHACGCEAWGGWVSAWVEVFEGQPSLAGVVV